MNLPAELLQAVSAPGGGKITLVIGAGCSLEAPTSIPLAGECSRQCHERLIADGILADEDCLDPSNLSSLADAVFAKRGTQDPLVKQLSQHYTLKSASPNEGHLLTAAMLREGAITSVLTLNFDLALSTAIAALGVGDAIGIIDGPDDLLNQNRFNLYYLHRNANESNSDLWILRTEALATEWRGKWQAVVTAKVLATPVVVFAGLGSPADVLIECTKLIQNSIPEGSRAYQVDPGQPNESAFFLALALDPAFFIQGKWCEFMAALSQRLVVQQIALLNSTAQDVIARDTLYPEDLAPLLSRLENLGLLELGRLRANCLLYEQDYIVDEELGRELVADVLLGIALITRVTGTTAIILGIGVVEFRRGDRIVSTHLVVSGRGSRGRIAIQSELSLRQRRYRGLASSPAGAIVGGIRDDIEGPITPPADVLIGDTSGSIIFGQTLIPIFNVASLRQSTLQCREIAP